MMTIMKADSLVLPRGTGTRRSPGGWAGGKNHGVKVSSTWVVTTGREQQLGLGVRERLVGAGCLTSMLSSLYTPFKKAVY